MVRRKLPLFQTLSHPTKVENPTASNTLVLLVVALCCLLCFVFCLLFHVLLFYLVSSSVFSFFILPAFSFVFFMFIVYWFSSLLFFFLVVAVAVTDVGGMYIWR